MIYIHQSSSVAISLLLLLIMFENLREKNKNIISIIILYNLPFQGIIWHSKNIRAPKLRVTNKSISCTKLILLNLGSQSCIFGTTIQPAMALHPHGLHTAKGMCHQRTLHWRLPEPPRGTTAGAQWSSDQNPDIPMESWLVH